MFSKNLGVAPTPLKWFRKMVFMSNWRTRRWWFFKWHWWSLGVHLEQLTRATTLPWYGTGLSRKFICLSAGSLSLYKGLEDPGIRVVTSGGQQCNGPANRLPVRKTLVFSPAVALELRSTEVDGQGLPGMYTPQGRRPY
jgi:hypothetical protein